MDKKEQEFRVKLLKDMDKHLRDNIQDEEIFCGIWLSVGVPDGACEYDYEDIAEDDELYNDCLEAFARCIILDK